MSRQIHVIPEGLRQAAKEQGIDLPGLPEPEPVSDDIDFENPDWPLNSMLENPKLWARIFTWLQQLGPNVECSMFSGSVFHVPGTIELSVGPYRVFVFHGQIYDGVDIMHRDSEENDLGTALLDVKTKDPLGYVQWWLSECQTAKEKFGEGQDYVEWLREQGQIG